MTQCNGSATGGGNYAGKPAVDCNVTGDATALAVTINQCNGTATGGGSSVACATTINDTFAVAAPTTTTAAPTTTTTAPTTTTTAPTTNTTGSGGGGSGGGSGSTPPAGPVIPTGAPQTGLGGASHSDNPLLVVLGALALVGAGLATLQAVRRRRVVAVESGKGGEGGTV